MSRSLTIDGTERADLTRLESFSFQESAYRGEVGQGGFDVESPAGAVSVPAWKNVLASDSDSGRIFTGQTIDRGVGRGSFTTDAEATWDVQVVDYNTVLDDVLLGGTDGDRPAESDVARVQWLLAYMVARGYALNDDYLSTADPETMEAYNYKGSGQFPRGVLDTCAEQAGKSFYLFYDIGVTNLLQLWYGRIADNTRFSDYRISSVDTDIDDYGVTWPAEWPEASGLQRDPSRVYSGVQVMYGTGQRVNVSRPTTEAAFKRRETQLFTDTVKSSTTATRLGNYFLDAAATEEDTITVAVTVPTTHVNAFLQGQHISCKFPHLGYDDFTNLYCVRRTVEPAGSESKAPDRYRLILVLKSDVKITRFSGGPGTPPNETEPEPGGPSEPADTETVGCSTPAQYGLQNEAGIKAFSGDDEVGSVVYYNIAWAVAGCPIGGGAWISWHDEEQWFEFTAPADDPKYLGMVVTIDATAISWAENGPLRPPFIIRAASGGVGGGTRFGEGSGIGTISDGGVVTVYVARSLITWGGANCVIIAPTWQCERDALYCNPVSAFYGTTFDGRGNSASAHGFTVGDVCVLQYSTGATGSSGWVAGLGDVDGSNATFTLIDWAATGTVEASINGLIQPNADVTLDTGGGTATLAGPPPAGAIVLFLYTVAAA